MLALVLLARVARSGHHLVPFDRAGQFAGVLAMAAVVYTAIEAGRAGFTDTRVVVACVVAVLALVAFVVVQARVAHPMVPLELFGSRAVVTVVVIGFVFMVGYYGMPFVMSLVLQQHGLSTLGTGVAFVPMMLAGLVLAPLVPRVVARVGARVVVATGLVVMALGLLAIAIVPVAAPIDVVAALMVLVGLAGPTVIPPVIAVLLNAVPAHRAGAASGVLNSSRQLGGALAVAAFGGLLAAPSGMRVSLLLAAVVVVTGAVAALAGLRARR